LDAGCLLRDLAVRLGPSCPVKPSNSSWEMVPVVAFTCGQRRRARRASRGTPRASEQVMGTTPPSAGTIASPHGSAGAGHFGGMAELANAAGMSFLITLPERISGRRDKGYLVPAARKSFQVRILVPPPAAGDTRTLCRLSLCSILREWLTESTGLFPCGTVSPCPAPCPPDQRAVG
jgi:hypothetical protein